MPDKRCRNGHFIDESWDICPYCPPEAMHQSSARTGARQEPPTMPPGPPTNVIQEPSQIPAADPAMPAPQKTVTFARFEAGGDAERQYVVGWLVGLNGTVRGESFDVRMGRNRLGRSRDSEVVIRDDQASSHHADLIYRPDEKRFILMDHNSTNGTYVNGKEIEPRRDLMTRDVITIGSHRLLFISLSELGLNWDDRGELR